MEIKSSNSSTILKFSDINGNYFRVSIINIDYSATIIVWGYTDTDGLVDLFESMSKNWRGWDDDKMWWNSIGCNFSITCKNDKKGHITMSIQISNDKDQMESWDLKTELVVDSCQLDLIAKEAKEFFKI